jgi:hypothetical protein
MNIRILALACALALPFGALAQPSYDYVEVSYQFGGDLEGANGNSIDADGYVLEGSISIKDDWFAQFSYNEIGTDPEAIDISDWMLLFGWHNELFYAKAGIESAELDLCLILAPPCSVDDSGYNVDFGLRGMATEMLELNGHVGYSDLGDLDNFINYGVGAVFMFTDSMGVALNYDLRSGDDLDTTSYGIGLRIGFR